MHQLNSEIKRYAVSSHTLRGRSRRGQRRDPQYGAPNFRRCIVHFAHERWNDTDCA